jgi:uncharacterized membrane protein YphA (DoxX/SURF4 family)
MQQSFLLFHIGIQTQLRHHGKKGELMKSKAPLIARLILGLIFFIFGLNGFLQFLPMPPLPEKAMNFMGALIQSGYLFTFVKATEVLVGAMLLTGFQVPLALILITPIALNIFLFHLVLVGPSTVGMAVLILALVGFLAWSHRDRYRAVFAKLT